MLATGSSTVLEPPRPRIHSIPTRWTEFVEVPPVFLDGGEGDSGGNGGKGGGGGGGWSGGEGESEGEQGDSAARPLAAREFAFGFVLLGVTTIFAVFLAAFLMLRRQSETWPPPGAPEPPTGLWMSTALVLASSIALFAAARGVRRRNAALLRRGLAVATALAVLFLVSQGFLWSELLRSGHTAASDAYGAVFYSLTGLHALHALAGVGLLAYATWRSRRRPFSPEARSRLKLGSLYWHFLGGIWVVLFVVLYYVE